MTAGPGSRRLRSVIWWVSIVNPHAGQHVHIARTCEVQESAHGADPRHPPAKSSAWGSSVPSASTSIAGAAASCSPGTTTHPSRSRRETLVCGHRVNAVFRLRRLSFLTLAGGESTSVFLLPTPRSQPRSQTRQWCASRLLTAVPRGAYYRCSPLPAVPTSIVSCSIYSTALYELVITQ
jgi:hypothetical protein